MKCNVVQRRLLSIAHPERVPADLRGHLGQCAACREWHNQLILLESQVRLLPIPASSDNAKRMRRLLRANAAAFQSANRTTKTHACAATLPISRTLKATPSRARILAAASILFLALGGLGLWSWLDHSIPTPNPSRADSLVASLVQRDLRLARASTPDERIEILAALADDLHGETRALAQAGSTAELTALAKLYEEVVRQGISKQAEALAPADRSRAVAAIAPRLAETAARADQLAHEFPASLAAPLHAIAAAARAAHRQLRALKPEGKV